MSEVSKYIFEITVLTFVCALIILGLIIWLLHVVRRRHDRTDTEVKNVGKIAADRADWLAENMDLDHRAQDGKLKKISGRLQFLTAKEIAVQLAEEKARQVPKQPPPQDIQ
jgi:hypothetical protein